MKKLSVLLFVTGVLTIGCKKDSPKPESPYVRFGQSSLQLAPIPGAEAELTVESNIAWKLNTGAEFDALLEIDKKQGSGNTTIHLKTRLNATTEKTVTVKAVAADKPDEVLATLTVTQKPYNPQIETTRYYGGDLDEYANAVIATPDGGVIVAGNAYSRNNGHVGENHKSGTSDFWLVKLNSSNDTVWTKLLGGDRDEYATAICKIADGSYIVAGSTRSHNSGDVGANKSGGDLNSSDFWVVKFTEKADKTGIDTVWTRTIGTDADEIATAVTATSDNAIVITGVTHKNAGTGDYYTAKLRANGSLQWAKQEGGPKAEYAHGVAAGADGGCVVVGRRGTDANMDDMYFVHYDSEGGVTDGNGGGGTKNDNARSITALPGGGYAIVGSSERETGGGVDAVLLIMAENGTLPYEGKFFGGSGYDEAMSVAVTNDGGLIIAGHTTSGGNDGDVTDPKNGAEDYWIMKLNSSYGKLWDKSFGTTQVDIANGIAATTDGKYVVVGYSPAASKGRDYGILKIKDH